MPHAQQDTTGACEGFHSALKGDELAMKTRLQDRRVDWLLHSLWNEVCSDNQHVLWCQLVCTSFVTTCH